MQSSISRWSVHPQLSPEQFRAARQMGIEPLQCQLLANRGIMTVEEMLQFIRADETMMSDPFALIDMERAVLRIERALLNSEHITIYGDYDADGVTSSALLFRALRLLKQPEAVLDYHIPHRLDDGYGLHIPALDQLKARGTSLIITTDSGSSDVEQVAYAQSLGMDVIITDHHQLPEELPVADALVNPWRTDGEHYLSGVGVAFKLAQALYRALACKNGEEKSPRLQPREVGTTAQSRSVGIGRELELLDLVAIGTIADVVLLLGENHTLVRLGMQRLNATRNPGLQALIRIARLRPGHINERDVSFGLAPRINAAGRMKEARIAFELLTTDDEQIAKNLATELEQLNIARKQQTEELMRAVQEQAQCQSTRSVILVSGQDWHEGIIGLVAGRLAEEAQKPVLVLNTDPQSKLSRGSARSPKYFNIIAALRGFGDQLERYGGHAQAAGFTIKSERIAQLHDHLLNWQTSSEDANASITKAGQIDLTFTKIERLTYRTYQTMHQLSPFGAGNPEPTFKMEKLRLLDISTNGYNQQNLRLLLGSDDSDIQLSATYTRGASELLQIKNASHVNIIFKLESSEDEMRPDIWLKILAIEAS